MSKVWATQCLEYWRLSAWSTGDPVCRVLATQCLGYWFGNWVILSTWAISSTCAFFSHLCDFRTWDKFVHLVCRLSFLVHILVGVWPCGSCLVCLGPALSRSWVLGWVGICRICGAIVLNQSTYAVVDQIVPFWGFAGRRRVHPDLPATIGRSKKFAAHCFGQIRVFVFKAF